MNQPNEIIINQEDRLPPVIRKKVPQTQFSYTSSKAL